MHEISWKEQYKLGVDSIDEQHMELFGLVNNLAFADVHSIKLSVMELFSYTRRHFHQEEELMAKEQYLGLDHHRNLHDKLIAELSEITRNGLNEEGEVERFRQFVGNWLKEHILNDDMDFVRFHKSLGEWGNGDGQYEKRELF